MPVHGLLQTSVSTTSVVGKNRPVGLLHDRTGIPAFLLALKGLKRPETWEVQSLEQATQQMRNFENESDRRAWNPVLAFFDAQGSEARIVGTPLSARDSGLAALSGSDRGPGRRTGSHLLADAARYADLFVIPQAAEFATGLEALRGFWEELSVTVSAMRGPFALLDAPVNVSVEQIAEATRALDFSDAAIFHPWLQVKELILPPSAVVAAAIQKTDREVGIHELASNRAGIGNVCPIRELSPEELRLCRDNRIGTYFIDDKGSARLWGSDTLSLGSAAADRILSVRRTLQAMRSALEQICEPYVMEPVGEELPVHLETRLTNFLHQVRGKLDREHTPPYQVEVRMAEHQGEPAMDVSVKLSLPRTLEQISVEMNLSA
jgi:hypothetical protein